MLLPPTKAPTLVVPPHLPDKYLEGLHVSESVSSPFNEVQNQALKA